MRKDELRILLELGQQEARLLQKLAWINARRTALTIDHQLAFYDEMNAEFEWKILLLKKGVTDDDIETLLSGGAQ